MEAWFQAMHASAGVMERYRACFSRKTPPIGFMWGTFDLRDMRLGGTSVPLDPDPGYIGRNAMDEDLVESGWWPGSEAYPRPAYYSFTHPKPAGIEDVDPEPAAGRWDAKLGEFVLDYDDVRDGERPRGGAARLPRLDLRGRGRTGRVGPGLDLPRPAPEAPHRRHAMSDECTHLDQIAIGVEPSGDGCKECMETGGRWVHLRRCTVCGHIGCCDSSPGKHATKHAHESGPRDHAVVRAGRGLAVLRRGRPDVRGRGDDGLAEPPAGLVARAASRGSPLARPERAASAPLPAGGSPRAHPAAAALSQPPPSAKE